VVRGPHNFRGAPVAQPATTKFGTKVVTATYYRSDCENSLYYRTRRDHGCCISQCPVRYPVKFDAYIFYQVRSYWHFLFSHNLKIQDGGGRHFGFSGYVNFTIPAC